MERNQIALGQANISLSNFEKQVKDFSTNNLKPGKKWYGNFTGIVNHSIFHSGELIVVTGEQSMGKRPFVLSLLQQLTANESIPIKIQYFTFELSAQQVFTQFVCNVAEENVTTILAKIKSKMKTIEKFEMDVNVELMIDEEKPTDFVDLIKKMTHNVALHQNEVFVIDYLELLGNCRDDKREAEKCLKALKQFAIDHNTLVIVISRLACPTHYYKGLSQIPSDSKMIKDFGKYNTYADHILRVFRPEYYGVIITDKDKSTAGRMLLYGWNKFTKQSFTYTMKFNAQYFKVYEK